MHISMKCSVAIHCLIFIFEYGEQTKVSSELLSRSTGVNPVTIRNTLGALKKAGILSIRQGTAGTRLRCPPSEIDLFRVCTALEPDFLSNLFGIHSSPAEACPIGYRIHDILDSTYGKIKQDLCLSLKRITLEQIIQDYHRRLSEKAREEETSTAAPS